MCFVSEMRDILEKKKEPAVATSYSVDWYIEDLLLAYKYDFAENYFRDLFALKKVLPSIIYHFLEDIGEKHFERMVIL